MRIIDCDSHCIVPDIFDNVPAELTHLIPKLKYDSENRLVKVTYDNDPSIGYAPPLPITTHCDLPGMSHIPDRIKNLNLMKVDLQLLCPQELAMRFNYSVEKNLGAAMAHSYNVSLKKIVDQYPDRFFGAPLVPLQDIDLALSELDWIIENNFKLVYVDYIHWDSTTNKSITRSLVPRIDEFYKKCEENNIVMFVHFFMHQITHDVPNNIKLVTDNEQLNFIEIALYDLLISDVFDRFPKLQMVVTEGAQRAMGKILRLIDKAYKEHKEIFKCSKHPIHYLKNNISYTVDIEMKESFDILMKYFGSSRLLFSTDYPHIDPSGLNKWKDTDDLFSSGLSQEDLENIAYRNAEKLFSL